MSASVGGHGSAAPSPWVVRWASLIPTGSRVLDLACGSGRHVRLMAGMGLQVTAVDRDASAVDTLRTLPGVEVMIADIEAGAWPFGGQRFAAIVVTNYLWRPLWPTLLDSLLPGGLLIYETFSVDHASLGKPSNPEFLLAHGELLARSAGLRVLAYEDGFLSAPDRFVQRITAVSGTGDAALQSAGSAHPRAYPL